MGSLKFTNTGYNPTSDSSAGSFQMGDNDILLGNHCGLVKFTTSINGIAGTSATTMNNLVVTDAQAYLRARDSWSATTRDFAISTDLAFWRGSAISHSQNFTYKSCSVPAFNNNNYKNVNITHIFNTNGTAAYGNPQKGTWWLIIDGDGKNDTMKSGFRRHSLGADQAVYITARNYGGDPSGSLTKGATAATTQKYDFSISKGDTSNSFSLRKWQLQYSNGTIISNNTLSANSGTITITGLKENTAYKIVLMCSWSNSYKTFKSGTNVSLKTASFTTATSANVTAGNKIYASDINTRKPALGSATQGSVINNGTINASYRPNEGVKVTAAWYNGYRI